jgi:hypothetical protein
MQRKQKSHICGAGELVNLVAGPGLAVLRTSVTLTEGNSLSALAKGGSNCLAPHYRGAGHGLRSPLPGWPCGTSRDGRGNGDIVRVKR